MKFFFVTALIAVGFLASNNAIASYDNCLEWENITVNSGNTGRKCLDDGGNLAGTGSVCTTTSTACSYAVVTPYSCTNGSWLFGLGTASGKNCCVKNCSRVEEEMQVSRVEASSDDNLQEVFEERATAYFGYVNNTVRSPTSGRGNSAAAKLDACIGHNETDMLGTGSTGWAACHSKCDGTANGYCNNFGTNDSVATYNAPCKDRCDCQFGFGTCEGQ